MKRTIATLAVIAAAGLAILSGGTAAFASNDQADLAAIRSVTAKYHNVQIAIADGYVPTDACVPGMGYHYVKPANVMDPAIDPLNPEVLLFAPSPDGVKLVGVEYMKVDADQDLSTDDDRPSVIGQPFEGPMLGHEPGMPIHYDKHVWIWSHNVEGMFNHENPDITCA
jgi:hypothetical protein